MKIHVKRDRHNEWHVWVSLDETPTRDLENSGETFIIAKGNTRDEALLNGWAELAKAAGHCERMQERAARKL